MKLGKNLEKLIKRGFVQKQMFKPYLKNIYDIGFRIEFDTKEC